MKIKINYLDESFNKKSSILECSNIKEVYTYINSQKYTLINYRKVFFKTSSIKNKDIHNFISSLYYLIKANVTLLNSLDILKQNFLGEFKENIEKTVLSLKSGNSLKRSFMHISHDEIFLNTIEIGEESGNLSLALENLKNKYEFSKELKKEIINLSLYPSLVLITSIIIISFLLKFIVPKFSIIYSDLNKEVPIMTQIILKISNLYEKYFIIISLISILFCFFIILHYKKNKIKYEKLFLKLPFIKNIYKELQVLYFSQSMNLLINSKIDILKSLDLSKYFTNFLLKNEITYIKKKIEQGSNFSESIKNSTFFDNEYKNYILIGEEIGNLGFSFAQITEIYLVRIKDKIKQFLKILEPISIIIIALFIGIIIGSIMLPIFKLGETINL